MPQNIIKASKSSQISGLGHILIDNSEVVIRFFRLKCHTVGTAGWIKADILTGLSMFVLRAGRGKRKVSSQYQ